MRRRSMLIAALVIGAGAGELTSASRMTAQPPPPGGDGSCEVTNGGPICRHDHICAGFDPYTWACTGYNDYYMYYQ